MQYLQLALPVALILWLALLPMAGRARILHVAMTAALVLTAILAFAWLWPSAYAPIGLILSLVLAVLLGRRRAVIRGKSSLWPGLLAGVLALVTAFAAAALVPTRLRPAVTVDLGLPFATAFVVTEGGTRQIINTHRAVAHANSPSLSGWQGMAHGVTLQPVDAMGRILAPPQTLLAPCTGRVAGQGNDTRLGLFVMLACADAIVVMSNLVAADVRGDVTQGQPIGTAQTLTLHAQSAGTASHPFSGTALPLSLNGIYPVRGWVLRP